MRRSNKNHPEHEQYQRQRAAWEADPTAGPWNKSAYNLWANYSAYHVVVGDGSQAPSLLEGWTLLPPLVVAGYFVWLIVSYLAGALS